MAPTAPAKTTDKTADSKTAAVDTTPADPTLSFSDAAPNDIPTGRGNGGRRKTEYTAVLQDSYMKSTDPESQTVNPEKGWKSFPCPVDQVEGRTQKIRTSANALDLGVTIKHKPVNGQPEGQTTVFFQARPKRGRS